MIANGAPQNLLTYQFFESLSLLFRTFLRLGDIFVFHEPVISNHSILRVSRRVIFNNKQNGQDCYDTSEVGHFSSVIPNQKELIPICSPAIMTVFEFPPRLSLSRNVNTESLYGTNSFFRKDGRLDVVEELMEFSAKREINTTCISCVTDV